MLGISKETVHTLPEVHYPGRVILIDSASKARDAVAYLLKQPQIGFDTETRPSFRKDHRYKVSLVQLSVPGECFLFRLKQIGSLDGLMSIFENPHIQKIGLSLKDDFHSLAKLCEFTPAGFVELQTFVKEYEIADNSLQKIFALIFGQRISKNQRLTNWEAAELTPGQQSYAAIDAWACVEIYNHLCAGKFNPEECPYRIDDETALMLQNSVGIHLPLKHADGESQPAEGGVSQAIVESTALNGTPVRRRRTVSSKTEKGEEKRKRPKAKEPKAKAPKTKEPKPRRRKSTDSQPAEAKKATAKTKAAPKTKAAAVKAEQPANTVKASATRKAAKAKSLTTKPEKAVAEKAKSVKSAKTAKTKDENPKTAKSAVAKSKTAKSKTAKPKADKQLPAKPKVSARRRSKKQPEE